MAHKTFGWFGDGFLCLHVFMLSRLSDILYFLLVAPSMPVCFVIFARNGILYVKLYVHTQKQLWISQLFPTIFADIFYFLILFLYFILDSLIVCSKLSSIVECSFPICSSFRSNVRDQINTGHTKANYFPVCKN